MMRILFSFFLIFLFVAGCGGNKKNKATHEEVVTDFVNAILRKDFHHAYELISPYYSQQFSEEAFTNYYLRNSVDWMGLDSVSRVKMNHDEKTYYQAEARIRYRDPKTKKINPLYEYFAASSRSGSWQMIWTKNLEDSMNAYYYNGDCQTAWMWADSALKMNPYCYECFTVIGECAGTTGDTATEFTAAKYVVDLTPRDPMALFNLGRIYSQRKKMERSNHLFWRSLKYIHDQEGRFLAYQSLALNYLELSKYDSTEICLNKAQEMDSSDYALKIMRCEVIIGRGELAKGLEKTDQLISYFKDPELKALTCQRIGIRLMDESMKRSRYSLDQQIDLAQKAKKYLNTAVKLSSKTTSSALYLPQIEQHILFLKNEAKTRH